jgi:hypothetical protein
MSHVKGRIRPSAPRACPKPAIQHASHTASNSGQGEKSGDRLYRVLIPHLSTTIYVADCCAVRLQLPRLSGRLRRNRTKLLLHTRSPEWLVALLLSRTSICAFVAPRNMLTWVFTQYDCLLALKCIDVLTEE